MAFVAKYTQHTRRIKFSNAVSSDFHSTSLIQGCALSMMLVNVMFSILSLYIKTRAPDIRTQYYVDDSKMRTDISNLAQLKTAIAANKTFELTGQMLSEK